MSPSAEVQLEQILQTPLPPEKILQLTEASNVNVEMVVGWMGRLVRSNVSGTGTVCI